jgi:taurine dioxygenase
MTIRMDPLAGNLGREVVGVDLAQPLDEGVARAIRQALFEHCVLVFRGQELEPAAQIRFTRLFGPSEPHPLNTRATVPGHAEVLILQNRPGMRGARNDYWHSDISHARCPPSASILHALEVPQGRGDTLICNMYAAWEQLSGGMQMMLSGMRAEHSAEPTLRRAAAERTDARLIDEVPPPNLHPVARTHPETGRQALFVNPHFTTRFEAMSREESAPLLDFLAGHATRPENVYRHRWQVGDVLMWDNRCTMHYAVRDYDESMRRLMHRTTAGGEAPR